jgi:cold shock CspA family protein
VTNRAEHSEAMRERGTIVSWGGTGMGKIEAKSGERLPFFYWTVVRGFDQLRVGQRVEFSRGAGLKQNEAQLVVVSEDS